MKKSSIKAKKQARDESLKTLRVLFISIGAQVLEEKLEAELDGTRPTDLIEGAESSAAEVGAGTSAI